MYLAFIRGTVYPQRLKITYLDRNVPLPSTCLVRNLLQFFRLTPRIFLYGISGCSSYLKANCGVTIGIPTRYLGFILSNATRIPYTLEHSTETNEKFRLRSKWQFNITNGINYCTISQYQ